MGGLAKVVVSDRQEDQYGEYNEAHFGGFVKGAVGCLKSTAFLINDPMPVRQFIDETSLISLCVW